MTLPERRWTILVSKDGRAVLGGAVDPRQTYAAQELISNDRVEVVEASLLDAERAKVEELEKALEEALRLLEERAGDLICNPAARHVLREALASSSGGRVERCDFCGRTEGHSKRCAVTRFGVNPKPPYVSGGREG
jgi:hypothetical protein